MYKKNRLNIVLCSVLLSLSLYACGTYSLKLNGQKKYIEKCYENEIEFKAMGIRGTDCVIYVKALKGEVDFYTDSLNIITYPNNDFRVWFGYDGGKIFGHQIIKENKTLECHISYGHFGVFAPVTEGILIPPNNFIMCDGKPLVTDTIRISLK